MDVVNYFDVANETEGRDVVEDFLSRKDMATMTSPHMISSPIDTDTYGLIKLVNQETQTKIKKYSKHTSIKPIPGEYEIELIIRKF